MVLLSTALLKQFCELHVKVKWYTGKLAIVDGAANPRTSVLPTIIQLKTSAKGLYNLFMVLKSKITR